jgi:septal ring factor EnvC (AmiA/AmiB activator)
MPEDLEARLEAHSARLQALTEEIEQLEAALEAKTERIDELEAELDRQQDRTELLAPVVDGPETAKRQHMGRLLQTLHRDAEPAGKASIDAPSAYEALNRERDRTTMYDLFDDIVELVDDAGLCWVERESRAAAKNTRLMLDLEGGQPPAEVGGVAVTGVAD